GLEDQCDRCGDVEMRRMLDEGLPCHRQGQHERMQGIDIEQRVKPILIEHHEAREHERAGEQMGDVEFEAVHVTGSPTQSVKAWRAERASGPRRGTRERGTPASWQSMSRTPPAECRKP